MIYQFSHKLLTSFYLWFEKQLVGSSVRAYTTNKANDFTYIGAVDSAGSWLAYQGEYRQLVADESVTQVNSGVFLNGSFISGDSSDIFIDYNDGRVIVPSASGQNLTITANSTVREVNTYLSNEGPESLLLHSDFVVQGDETNPYLASKSKKRDDKIYMLPACFLSLETHENQPFCFGGEEETEIRIRVFVVANDTYMRDGILSVFADKVRTDIRMISNEVDFPYGVFHSLKTYPYNYDTLAAAQTDTASNIAHIRRVYPSKVDNGFEDKFNRSLMLGFIDFDLTVYRYPRSETVGLTSLSNYLGGEQGGFIIGEQGGYVGGEV